jgi:hypothetical protein
MTKEKKKGKHYFSHYIQVFKMQNRNINWW